MLDSKKDDEKTIIRSFSLKFFLVTMYSNFLDILIETHY